MHPLLTTDYKACKGQGNAVSYQTHFSRNGNFANCYAVYSAKSTNRFSVDENPPRGLDTCNQKCNLDRGLNNVDTKERTNP